MWPLGRRDRQFSIQGSQGHRQDQTRRGGQGGVCARGGRSGHRQGRGAAAWQRTSERARRALAPEPWPRRAAGDDGAGIGASSVFDRRPARSQWGDNVPAGHRGRAPGGAQSDMTRSGVTARREWSARPPRPSRAGALGSTAPSWSLSFAFRKEPTQLCPRDLRTLQMTRNGATQLTPGPRTPDFFKSF